VLHSPTILFPDYPAWRILPPGAPSPIDLPFPDDASPTQIASAIAALLARHNYRSEGVLLALPSAWCLSASISTAGVPVDDRAALAFRLEEQLPIPAESFTADFIRPANEDDPTALGVAIPNDRLHPLIVALESAGIPIQSITPAATLALEACLPQITRLLSLRFPAGSASATNPSAAIIALPDSADRLNLFALIAGQPTHWITTESDPTTLQLSLDLLLLNLPPQTPILTCGLPTTSQQPPSASAASLAALEFEVEPTDPFADTTQPSATTAEVSIDLPRDSGFSTEHSALPPIDPVVTPQDLPELIRAHAHDLLTGRASPLLEFRRGALATGDPLRLHRRAINTALAAAAAFFLVAAGILFYRGLQYDRLASTFESQVTAEFKQHFPTWQVPYNVRAVVASERRKISDQGISALPPEARESALKLMRDVLVGIDAAAPITIEVMTFNDTSMEINGRCRSREDLNALIASCRAAGLDVPLPQVRTSADTATDKALSFNLKASKPLTRSATASP